MNFPTGGMIRRGFSSQRENGTTGAQFLSNFYTAFVERHRNLLQRAVTEGKVRRFHPFHHSSHLTSGGEATVQSCHPDIAMAPERVTRLKRVSGFLAFGHTQADQNVLKI